MATIADLPELTETPDSNDFIVVRDASDAVNKDKRVRYNYIAPDRAFWININDDNAVSVTPRGSRGFAMITTGAGSNEHVIVVYRTESSPHCIIVSAGATVIDATTGALTGTTGADGRITVSAHSDGRIYIENRRGGARSVRMNMFS